VEVEVIADHHSHPYSASVRNASEALIQAYLVHRYGGLLLDIGGNNSRRALPNVHGIQPRVLESDYRRVLTDCCCDHLARECDCAPNALAGYATHSAYYLTGADWDKIFDRQFLKEVFVLVHDFSDVAGVFPTVGPSD